MQTIDAIISRRSIRKYKNEKIDKSDIEKLLKSAMQAPSAFNRQPWKFIVIEDRKKLDGITSFSCHAQMIKTAPLAILICADKQIEPSIEHCFETCSAATQNILLAAHALKLGAVWTGVYPDKGRIDGFKKHFNIPQNIEPMALIVVGHPDEVPLFKDNYDEKKIFINSF